jgi:hypothetical protein
MGVTIKDKNSTPSPITKLFLKILFFISLPPLSVPPHQKNRIQQYRSRYNNINISIIINATNVT